MKKLFPLVLILVLITGCGISAQEKRNNYDACLIEEEGKFWAKKNKEKPNMYPSDRQMYEQMIQNALPNLCVDNLK